MIANKDYLLKIANKGYLLKIATNDGDKHIYEQQIKGSDRKKKIEKDLGKKEK